MLKDRHFAGPVGQKIIRWAEPILAKKGGVFGQIAYNWDKIAGAEIASYTRPQRLALPRNKQDGATLYIAVFGGKALQVQYQSTDLLERINSYFGYQVLIHLRCTHSAFSVL